jgi:hypothetical protein
MHVEILKENSHEKIESVLFISLNIILTGNSIS